MKAMSLPANSRCSIARSLEVLGQKWALLIVREAFLGTRRFSEFKTRIGVPSDILTSRLESLVCAGVLERHPYRQPGERARDEYVLTSSGRDLLSVLASFGAWGDVHLPTGFGPSVVYVDSVTGRSVRLAFVDDDGTEVELSHVVVAAGPGSLEE